MHCNTVWNSTRIWMEFHPWQVMVSKQLSSLGLQSQRGETQNESPIKGLSLPLVQIIVINMQNMKRVQYYTNGDKFEVGIVFSHISHMIWSRFLKLQCLRSSNIIMLMKVAKYFIQRWNFRSTFPMQRLRAQGVYSLTQRSKIFLGWTTWCNFL